MSDPRAAASEETVRAAAPDGADPAAALAALARENAELRREIVSLRTDLIRNKRARRRLALEVSLQESRLSTLSLVQEVVERINTIDNVPRLFREICAMVDRVAHYDAAALYLRQTATVYIAARRPLTPACETALRDRVAALAAEIAPPAPKTPPLLQPLDLAALAVLPPADFPELTELLARPVHAREECVGTIALYTARGGSLSVEQENHVAEILRTVSMLLDNAILYDRMFQANEALARRIGSLKRLLEISEALSGKMTPDALIDFILSAAVQEINADGGSLMLLDPRRGELSVQAIKGLPDEMKRNVRLRVGEGIAGLVAEEKEPLILLDSALLGQGYDEEYRRYAVKFFPFEKYRERRGVLSAVSIPLMIKREVVGVLNLTSSTYVFSEEDLEMVILFGSLAANAIENSRLIAMEERRIKELLKLSDIGKMLGSTFEHAQIIHLVIEALDEILKFHVALLLLEEEEGPRLTVVSRGTVGVALVESLKRRAVEAAERASGRTVAVEELEVALKKVGSGGNEPIASTFGSVLSATLSVKGDPRGVLMLLANEPDFFDEDAERTLVTFAQTVAVALDNSASYAKMERTVKELSMLFEVGKTVTSTLNLDEALSMIVSISAELIDARVAFLRLPDEAGDLVTKASYGDFDQELSQVVVPPGAGITGRVFSEGKPYAIRSLAECDLIANKEVFLSNGLNSCLAVPLMLKGRALGVIACFFEEVHRAAESEINLLSTLASHAAIAIENARMYEEMARNYKSTIMALSAAIDAKDHYTHGHSRNVMEYAVAIARELGLPRDEVETISFAGLLHDIGKIGIPEAILRKSSGLTDEEFRVIATHPSLGAAIMNQVDFLRKISPIACHHHERFDGRGYPDGLAGEAIPLGARILNLADSFDVMTTSRVYRAALSFQEAVEEVRRCRGRQFDPRVVDAFFNVVDKIYPEVKDSKVDSIVELVRKSYAGEPIARVPPPPPVD